MKVSTILDRIEMGSLVLPQFQRGYVWKRADVADLMRSLYRDYPVGSLLIWETAATPQSVKGTRSLAAGVHELLLDGQQRVTSLYGIINGKAPGFCFGDTRAFLNLYFNVESEEFEFYGPVKMRNDPRWVSVTELMQHDEWHFEDQMKQLSSELRSEYMKRLSRICKLKDRVFQVEKVTGATMTMDKVVDIFNKVNSGGTKLSKGDLALAKICADWPEARDEMQARLDKWRDAGYKFNLDWLLRCINALLTGHADFAELGKKNLTPVDIQDGLKRAEKHVDVALNLIASRLGLDHDRVMGSPNSLPAIARFFDRQNQIPDFRQLDRLLYWYIHALLWGHYSGPVETRIRQDLQAVDQSQDTIAAWIEHLRQSRGHLHVSAQDFTGWTVGSRFYPMLYLLSRVFGTRDLGSGNMLSAHLLGKSAQLELHHIFPKARLRKHDYHWYREVNDIANFTFLTKETNLRISDSLPADYFPEYESKHPGVLASHWIPADPALWKIENYRDFLEARRELLAEAANSFLEQLLHGGIPETNGVDSIFDRGSRPRPISVASDEEEAELVKAMAWMAQNGLPQGELGYELVDGSDGQVTILDLAWSQGIQTGKSQPAALLIDEDDETLKVASGSGFACFTNLPDLQRYVQRELLNE